MKYEYAWLSISNVDASLRDNITTKLNSWGEEGWRVIKAFQILPTVASAMSVEEYKFLLEKETEE